MHQNYDKMKWCVRQQAATFNNTIAFHIGVIFILPRVTKNKKKAFIPHELQVCFLL